MVKVLLTGKNGQVGWELERSLRPIGDVLALDRTEMDLADEQGIRQAIREMAPGIIINAAAYTAVDRAEEDQEKVRQINGRAPGIMAEEAGRLGSLMIHYSTDYVFDGEKEGPYSEDDEPAPLNIYGSSKLEGEEMIGEAGCDHLILRTSWVYGLRGQNFLLTMLRLFCEKEKLSIIADQTGAPSWSRLIAETTALVIYRALQEKKDGQFTSGTYHLTSRGATTWYGFARKIQEEAGPFLDPNRMKTTQIEAITTYDYPTIAACPRNSRLEVSALEERFDLQMPTWDRCLKLCLIALAEAGIVNLV